jgi:hypothetical protein
MGCGREQATLHEMGRSSSLPTSTPDPDPDQLACITCGQQWQATSLRGHRWHCPNGCNNEARTPQARAV